MSFGNRRRQQQSEREVPKEQEKEEKEGGGVNGGAVEDFRNLVKSGQDVRASLKTTMYTILLCIAVYLSCKGMFLFNHIF